VVVTLPNITNILYGRDVGYSVERIILDRTTEDISETKIRQLAHICARRKARQSVTLITASISQKYSATPSLGRTIYF
jgi:hypothetical protein